MRGKRDLIEYAKKGKTRLPASRVLSVSELQQLYSILNKNDVYEVICIAFFAGAEAGYRTGQEKKI